MTVCVIDDVEWRVWIKWTFPFNEREKNNNHREHGQEKICFAPGYELRV